MVLTGALAVQSGMPHPENPDAIEDGWPKRDPGPSEFGESEGYDDNLLEMPARLVPKKLVAEWAEQDPLHQRHNAECRANLKRREGHVNVQVVKARDEDRWEEWTWGSPVPHPNKAATLCRKAQANLNADPAMPEPLPGSTEPEDVDAAEYSARVLEHLCSEPELDDANKCREAFDLASTYASCYRYFRIEPHGRQQPVQIEAHPQATDPNRPFAIPVPVTHPFTGAPVLDPLTRQPATKLEEQPGPFVLRYVTAPTPEAPAGQLTDQRAQARLEWVPKLVDELLPSPQVRFLPATATYIDKADAILIGAFRSVGELRRMFPRELAEVREETIAAMCKYRPERPDDFLPGRGRVERAALDALKGDSRLVFTITCYYRSCARYPMGAYVCVAGDAMVLHRREWKATMQDGSEEALEIPVSQYMQLREGRQSQHGTALMTVLASGNDQRAGLLAHWIQHLDRFNSRKTFVPLHSIAKPADLENPTKLYIPINPQGQPVTEQIPEFPRTAPDLYDRIGVDMDHASGLEQAAQGVEDPSVGSGKHAQTIIAQVHAGLSELRENIIRAETRSWRIMLQLVRAYYTKPQQLSFEGKDGRRRHRRWSRADLGSTRDVRLKSATMTMLSPAAKLQFVMELVGMGLVSPQDALELITSNLAKTLGWKDDPHRLRIRRQLADWEEGPPPGWQPPAPVPGMGPNGPTLMPAPDPVLERIFEPTPADSLPPVAQIRMLEIARCMASEQYLRWPPQWRARLDQEFMLMQGVVQQAAAAAAPPEEGGEGGKPPGKEQAA